MCSPTYSLISGRSGLPGVLGNLVALVKANGQRVSDRHLDWKEIYLLERQIN